MQCIEGCRFGLGWRQHMAQLAQKLAAYHAVHGPPENINMKVRPNSHWSHYSVPNYSVPHMGLPRPTNLGGPLVPIVKGGGAKITEEKSA